MYDWDDSGSSDCIGYPEHVGIVSSVSKSTIKVIEGNKNDAVGYRNLKVNGKYIRGYCLPDYAKKAKSLSVSNTPLSKLVKWEGVVTASYLNIRKWAGTKNETCSFSPLKKGTVVGVCSSVKDNNGSLWYYVKYKGKYGFVSSKYIKKK